MKYEKIIKELIPEENIHHISNKEIRCYCPFHNDSRYSFSINMETGLYKCQACDEKGNIKNFVKAMAEKKLVLSPIHKENIDAICMFDNEEYKEKPTNMPDIKERIKNLKMEKYTLKELQDNILKGKTIIPAGIKGNAEENWKMQQVFLLDFDNKIRIKGEQINYFVESPNHVTVRKILDFCQKKSLIPTFIYNTFSHSEKQHKFRLVYIMDKPITDYKVAKLIIKKLLATFEGFNPDTQTENLSFMFFGGKDIAFSSDTVYDYNNLVKVDDKLLLENNNTKLNHAEIAQRLLEENNICVYNNNIYFYNNGVYEKDDLRLKMEIIKIDGNVTKHVREEVIDYLKIILSSKRVELDKNYINFKNGLYDIKQDIFLPHSPKIFTINQLSVNYNPNAEINKDILNFLRDITCCNIDRAKTIMQIIGYSMTTSVEFQTAFIFYGPNAENGKSKLLDLIYAIIGEKNTSHVTIQKLQEIRFSSAELENKLLNSVAELPSDSLKSIEIFKSVVTGDLISVEEKFKNRYTIRPYAKHIFTANELPRVTDTTNAFYRRLNILLFEATFSKEKKLDFEKNLHKLFSNKALEYLAFASLQEYKKLLESRTFCNQEESDKQINLYKIDNNNVLEFLKNKIQNYKDKPYKKSSMYEDYKIWCKTCRYEPKAKKDFHKEIEQTKLFEIKIRDGYECYKYIGE